MARIPVKQLTDAKKRLDTVAAKKVRVRIVKPEDRKPKKVAVRDGLPIKELLRETTARTKELMKLGDVTVTSMKLARSQIAILSQTATYHKNGTITRYKQVIENLDDDTDEFHKSQWIKVECTCPQFKFAHDYVLHQKGSSDLNYSTDEPPVIRNAAMLHGVCKHLLKVLQTIKNSKR